MRGVGGVSWGFLSPREKSQKAPACEIGHGSSSGVIADPDNTGRSASRLTKGLNQGADRTLLELKRNYRKRPIQISLSRIVTLK